MTPPEIIRTSYEAPPKIIRTTSDVDGLPVIRIPASFGPAGRGVPTGGTSGQALTKSSSTDYDAAWTTVPGVTPPYVHPQSVAATVWTVTHNLNFLAPNVRLIDNLGIEFESDIDYVNVNTLTVTIAVATSGSAYVSI